MKLPDTLDKFILWLIEQPFICSDSWRAEDDKIWLLAEVCAFTPDSHVKTKEQKDGRYGSWDGKYHTHCPMAIGVKVQSGGVNGGSCWGDSDPQEYHESYTLPDPTNLVINIIGEFFPDVTLVQYTRNFANIVHRSEYTHYEYYGNSRDYVTAYIPVELLYKCLKSLEN